jgi:butyryl-CoA dehydrogenase
MNEARIDVVGSRHCVRGLPCAVEYTRERFQGGSRTRTSRCLVLIVEHPDVKRMLLFQKAVVEGSCA